MVYDLHGRNPKVRPLVIVTQTHQISSTTPIAVVAITSKFTRPTNDDEVILPFHPAGQVHTGLKVESVAKCRWQEEIMEADVVEDRGFYVRNKDLAQILEKIAEIDRNAAG